jgi:glycosyltransferase involved in cell wall biosynthesis
MARGGAEIHTASLVKFMDPSRARVVKCIVTGMKSYDACVASSMGVPVVVGGSVEVIKASRECDVMLMWGTPLDGLLRGSRPPVGVYIAHGEGDWTLKALQGSRKSIDHVVAVSQRARERVCDGFDTTVIPNGVDRSRVAQTRPRGQVRESLGFGADDFVMLYCGRFSGEKNPSAVIEAAALLPERYKALLVGSGQMERELRKQAASLIPGRHAFASATDDVGDYYAAADCLVTCSSEEGSSLTIIEAMFAGLPIIATLVGAVPEMLDEMDEMFLEVDGSPEEVARAAHRLSEHDSWVEQVIFRAMSYAEENCYARQMADRYADLLCRLWAEKTSNKGRV